MVANMRSPNIVYILADDMGYGDLSCLNPAAGIHTNCLDQLAAEGMVFTDAHASSAVCTPSRYSILTGRYNWRSTLKEGVYWGYSRHLIESGRMTVASLLKSEGYTTACFGKWHLGMDFATTDGEAAWGDEHGASNVDWDQPIENGPTCFGFDRFHGIAASLDMPPYIYIEDAGFVGRPTTVKAFLTPPRPGPAQADFDAVDVLPTITARATSFIREMAEGETPFFLYMPLNAPHTPLMPTAAFAGSSGLNAYTDFCLQVDDCVGQVVTALEQSGLADNTLIMFTADNGCSPAADFPFLNEHGHYPSYHFRGHKADIYEGGHRIPLIARWPAVIGPGRQSDETVCLADLFATAAAIVGVEPPVDAAEDSVSNLPLLQGVNLHRPLREATVHHSIDGSFAIRQGRWKLEFCPGSGGWSDPKPGQEAADAPPIQLYDLHADIGERHNVQHEYPQIADRLQELMTRYVRAGRSTPGPAQPNTGPLHWPQLNWLAEADLQEDGWANGDSR